MMLPKEIWKEIPTHPNYMVSNYGYIHNIEKRREVNQHTNGHGGLKVVLYHKNQQQVFQVHHLVASLYLEDYDQRNVVVHIDGDRRNNVAWNLKMDTKRLKRMREEHYLDALFGS